MSFSPASLGFSVLQSPFFEGSIAFPHSIRQNFLLRSVLVVPKKPLHSSSKLVAGSFDNKHKTCELSWKNRYFALLQIISEDIWLFWVMFHRPQIKNPWHLFVLKNYFRGHGSNDKHKTLNLNPNITKKKNSWRKEKQLFQHPIT
jgi:hypothetical protein